MSKLPLAEAVERFRSNDERLAQFVNDPDGTGTFETSAGEQVKTLPALAQEAQSLELRLADSSSAAPARGSSMVGHDGGTVAIALDELFDRADHAARARFGEALLNKINENRSWIYPWGGRGITVLGDSISHMAFSRDAFKNNWTNILKRCVNAEFDKSSYGFVSLLPTLGSGATLSKEIHTVTRTGAWTELTTSDCEWSLSGFALESSTTGDTLDVVVPSFQRHFGVWYHSFAGGGTFEIYVNDVLQATVSTDGTAGSTRTSGLNLGRLDLLDNGKGACKITLKVASGLVRLMGISYENAEYDFQLSNFSQSGRRLRWVSQEVIQKCVRGSTTFILALGYNDNASAEADPDYFAAVQQRIDWIIAEATTYGVKLLVLDFVWTRAQTRALPTELKRCADAVPGSTYLRFGDYLKTDGALADGSWLTNEIRLYDDAAHPNVLGHKVIGETVAKVMGLSVNSKRAALDMHDFWMPIQLTGYLKNTFADPLQVTAFKRQGSVLLFRLYLYNETVNNSSVAVPAGNYDLISSAELPDDVYVPSSTFYPLVWSTAEDESTTPYISAFLEARFGKNGFRLLVKNTTKRNIEGAVVVPVFRSPERM
ncbi:hypothetical protein CNQ84_11660 [Pseudomonas abyssi]|uniref:Uncharacterized protein n=1 Tax=Pseudomonas abyssi TaxID=170540 RepID=A0A2A3MGU9_9PSED|nr:hypothetical protein [Pseudomonas abyssi]PBK04002.1 hypothetical protein CNQ84_11660 [Pseudomonas abyssi]